MDEKCQSCKRERKCQSSKNKKSVWFFLKDLSSHPKFTLVHSEWLRTPIPTPVPAYPEISQQSESKGKESIATYWLNLPKLVAGDKGARGFILGGRATDFEDNVQAPLQLRTGPFAPSAPALSFENHLPDSVGQRGRKPFRALQREGRLAFRQEEASFRAVETSAARRDASLLEKGVKAPQKGFLLRHKSNRMILFSLAGGQAGSRSQPWSSPSSAPLQRAEWIPRLELLSSARLRLSRCPPGHLVVDEGVKMPRQALSAKGR